LISVYANTKGLIVAPYSFAAGDIAYEAARRLLDEHKRMVLSGVDRDALLAAIDRTPHPARRLVKALKRHRDLFG